MGTRRLGSFPSMNNKLFQDDIAKRLLEWFISRFPSGFFNHIYLDIGDSQSLSDNLSTFSGHMKNIAEIFSAEIGSVSVKATTEEGLGFTGDGSGIAVHAVCIMISE